MPNGLTDLTVDLYAALDVVSRELVGFIPAVTSDMTYTRAAVGQTVRSFVTPKATTTDIVPGVIPPDDGDQNIGNVALTIIKSKRSPIRWNGEQQLALNNNGAPYNKIFVDQTTQSMRELVNEVEADLAALASYASRAWGTPGTMPFLNGVGDSAQLRKILADNGTPMSDLQCVINTSAGAAMRTNYQLTKVNEAGDGSLLRRGVLLDLHGFAIRESGQLSPFAAGTAATVTTDAVGYPVGAVTINLGAGTGILNPGDVFTLAGDPNQYVVKSVSASPVAAGVTVTISTPGLMQAIPAAATALTVVGGGTMLQHNLAFRRSAIALATRAPALPQQGDSAIDRMIISDPMSGLSFEVAMYAQYRQMQYEVSLAWGCGMVKSDHAALLIG